ncbi:single-stranded DNA-binding protein [Clostridium cadaveris]|uniref:single-stranded DNA-binding protein n=1 Tax=Clostridium cadaveris TaxID=1529 RepID=UPI0015B52F91|nr:single-stranded DNA-binding protein [Clostridium cadaveris]
MNKVVLIGRLTKDPELRYTPGTGMAVTTVTLAVDRFNASTKQREADFISVVIWGKQAENTANYMSKGSQMAISGRIQTRSYDDKEGKKRYITEVVAQEVSFLSKGVGTQSNGNNQDFGQGFDEDIMPVDDMSDIPF